MRGDLKWDEMDNLNVTGWNFLRVKKKERKRRKMELRDPQCFDMMPSSFLARRDRKSSLWQVFNIFMRYYCNIFLSNVP